MARVRLPAGAFSKMDEKIENKGEQHTNAVLKKHPEAKKKFNFNYDKHYGKLFLIPVILMLFSVGYLFYFYSQTGEFIIKDVSLSGGTTITVFGNFSDTEIQSLESSLMAQYDDISFRRLTESTSGKSSTFVIESQEGSEKITASIEEILGIKLTQQNSSIEFSDSALGESFYRQLITSLFISFVLMSIVIFILFRSFVPSMAVIFAAFSDIVMPLALIDYLGIKLSAAGIAAFLMLIGYSVDTDILLTTRALKKQEGTINERIYGAFKTGIFMNVTALAAVLPAFFIVTGLPDSFRQIFFILALGLVADIINTWLTNASIIKWYCDRKGIK